MRWDFPEYRKDVIETDAGCRARFRSADPRSLPAGIASRQPCRRHGVGTWVASIAWDGTRDERDWREKRDGPFPSCEKGATYETR